MISRNNNIHPDDEMLRKPLTSVLDMAIKHLPLLLPGGFISNDHPDDNLRAEKLTGETALMLYFINSCIHQNKEITDRVNKLAALLLPHARNKKLLVDICLHPAYALEYAQPHILLTKIGLTDPKFDHLLRRTINGITAVGLERMPHRMMEQNWLQNLWDNKTGDSNYNLYIPFTQLDYPIYLLHPGREEIYAFTHAIMYVTDFGKCPALAPLDIEILVDQAEALLVNRIEAEDYDLAGELLLTWPLLSHPLSNTASFALNILLHLADDAGFLPSQSLKLETLNQLEGEEKSKYFFATSYHTAYVMALLCAALVKENKAPVLTSEINLNHADFLMSFREEEKNKNWFRIFTSFSENDQNLGAAFICNLALIKTMREKDYKAASRIIRFRYKNGLSSNTLSTQSIALMERLSIIASSSN